MGESSSWIGQHYKLLIMVMDLGGGGGVNCPPHPPLAYDPEGLHYSYHNLTW